MLTRIFPFLLWFEAYDSGTFKTDLVAGITVAMVLIPQSMAYAQLAGLPAYYGLYAAFLPPMIAALFGSSRQLATGPVAIVSMMSAASLEPLATAGSAQFIAYSVLLALTVGIFQFLLGTLRLGLVVNLLSHPVVNGFTNAAAIIIASSQFSKLFGVYVDKAPHHYQTIIHVIQSALHYTHLPTLGLGVFAIAVMLVLKRVAPKVPNVLVAVALTIVLSKAFHFNNDQVVTTADIHAPKVLETIAAFNDDIRSIERLAEERATLNNGRKELPKGVTPRAPSSEQLEFDYRLAMINAEIQGLKEASRQKREALRRVHLLAPEESAGAPGFYVGDTLPTGMKTDGRSWRIRVKNRVIADDAIEMIGAGAVVGEIPRGLKLSVPAAPENSSYLAAFVQLLPYAVIISLLGFMEAIAIAKAMAAKTGQKLDPNQELIGQGLANMIGAFGQSYAVSGSFSRSAVNLQANAVSGISSVVTSIMVALTLLFFTPLLYHLPQAVLAAVIMMAVIGLINVRGFVHAWKAKRADGVISVVTFVCTLYFAPNLEEGIYVGVGMTFLVFLFKSLRPQVALLSRSHDDSLKSAEKYGLKECDHIAVVRFDGALIFTNATYLEDKVLAYIAEKPDLKHVIIEASGINDIDASGEEALAILVETVRESNRDVSFSGVKERVFDVLKRTHLLETIGEDHFYATGDEALKSVYEKIHREGECQSCPLSTYLPREEKSRHKVRA